MSVGHQTWIGPKEGWIKLNTDTSFVADMGEASAECSGGGAPIYAEDSSSL
jgi:hypothetical protein